MSLAGTFALLCLLIPQALAGQGLDTATAQATARGGYFDTAWPSEHADLWRSHAAQGAGLPAGFDPATLTVTQASLDLPVWGYTRAKDEVFVIGGSPFTLSTFTQSMKTGKPVRGVAAFFAMAGDLLSGSRPYLAKIRPSDMSTTITPLTGGSTVNYTGGLLMHRNGSVYAVARSMLYKIDPQTMTIEKSVKLPLVEGSSFWTTYNDLQVLPLNALVSAHRVRSDGSLEPVWERSGYRASASPALVPDRDLLYIDDWKDGHDHLVVLRLSSGEELASLALSAKLPTIGTIFPGMNGDVYLLSSEAGGGKGLISRIFIQSTDERSVR